jgi:alpha-L-arabinofuranosidase
LFPWGACRRYSVCMTTIQLRTDEVIARVSPHMTGACLEDVNHEVYGGIYSQMVFGESFEEEPMLIDRRLSPEFEGLSGTVSCLAARTHLKNAGEVRSWQPFRRGDAAGKFRLSTAVSRRGNHSQVVSFISGTGEVGIENRGLNRWGMSFVEGKAYEGVIVVRAEALPGDDKDATTEMAVALESGGGESIHAETALAASGGEWQVLEFELTPSRSDTAGRLVIKLRAPGTVRIDYVALHPGEWGRFKGLPVRRDIAEALVEQGLTVMRFGGWMINTRDLEKRGVGPVFRWKNMIGPRHDRPPYFGTFYRYETNGFGIIEFIAFCRAAGFLPIPVLSSLETPEDVTDFIEYVNGPADSEWGGKRVADGYPDPFGIRHIQIGNEEWGRDYADEFRVLSDAVAAADPEIASIVSMWWTPESMAREDTRELLVELIKHARGKKVLWDLHVGGDNFGDGARTEKLFTDARAFLDKHDPGSELKFCVLEENGGRHDLQRALGHAVNINAAERHGDDILIDCPANCLQPWKQNDNDWDQGQVFFTPSQVWGMPPYYAQQMIARNYLPLCVSAECNSNSLNVTATRSEDRKIVVVKIVNMADSSARVSIQGAPPGSDVMVCSLAGEPTAENTPKEPTRVVSAQQTATHDELTFRHELSPTSFTVFRFTNGRR